MLHMATPCQAGTLTGLTTIVYVLHVEFSTISEPLGTIGSYLSKRLLATNAS